MCQNSFFEKITPTTNSCGRGDSFNLGIMTHPHIFIELLFPQPVLNIFYQTTCADTEQFLI